MKFISENWFRFCIILIALGALYVLFDHFVIYPREQSTNKLLQERNRDLELQYCLDNPPNKGFDFRPKEEKKSEEELRREECFKKFR